MIKIISLQTYKDVVKTEVDLMKLNAELRKEIAELRKVCQCRECKWYESEVCVNGDSDNRAEFMNPYGSCEKCERRTR